MNFIGQLSEDLQEKGFIVLLKTTFLRKDLLQIGLEKYVCCKKIKKTVPWTCVISDLNGEEIAGCFYEKELQKTNQKEFRIEKVIKRKGNKLYVKWKGYNNSFNSWIDKKDLIK